jgi:endonuclease/exonuclease/phosphatase family metal-dependent hydrolase
VLTWNVQDFPMAAGTVEALAEVLVDLDADVVAVQEIAEPAALGELLEALPGYDGLLNDDPGAWSRVGLLYRRARVELLEVETLFADDWYAFPRPPLAATLRASPGTSGGEAFDFVAVVLHLKARLDDESRDRRRTACERLEAWLEARLAEGGEEDYVLLGDWNDELTDWGDHNVFEVFLDRADSYSFLTLDLAEAGGFTYIPFESFLDHVMVTASALDEYGPGGTTSVLDLERTVPGYLDLLSDHRPVLSVFEVP